MDANILQSYLAECARLARDLQQVSDDLEFVHDKKGKLRFAVDYSEIYALSHPDETPDEFRLFKDDPTALSSALQKVALERLFFEEAERPILLMPYAAELRDAMIRMEREDHYKMEELIQKVPGFLAWGEQLWSNPETKSLLELVNKASASNASIDPSDEQRLISFFERNTPLILALSKPQSENAFSALMKLFQSKRLEDLEEVLHLSEDTFESETSKRWFVGIHDLRKKYPERERSSDNSSMYDAWAMSILEQANRELAKSSTKLCLVTRSEAMAEMLQSEIRERKWDQLVGNIIRHPRYFSYLQRLDKLEYKLAKEDLLDRLVPINALLSSIQKESKFAGLDEDEEAHIARELSRIKDDWRSAGGLLSSLQAAPPNEPNSLNDKAKDSLLFLKLIRNEEGIRRMIFERLRELKRVLEGDHEALAVYASALQAGKWSAFKDRFDSNAPAENSGPSSAVEAMPYTLQFYTESAKLLLARLGSSKKPLRSWGEVIDLLEDTFGRESDFEKVLVMAYMLGTINKWRLAETYCRKALELARGKIDTPTHEGLFFLAICYRKWKPTAERHLEAVGILSDALALKSKWLEKPGYKDPRYLKEQGTHLILLDLYFSTTNTQYQVGGQDGMRLLREAERLSSDDKKLRVQICNNILFYHVEKNAFADKRVLIEEYDKLIRLQSAIEIDRRKWPGVILDTAAWTKWTIWGASTSAEMQEIVSTFDMALVSGDLTSEEQERIRGRRDIVLNNQRNK